MSSGEETDARVQRSLFRLEGWVRSKDYCGYDPYDGLNARNLEALFGNKISRMFFTQFLKFHPINMRDLLGVEAGPNSKGLGLFLRSYLKIYNITGDERYLDIAFRLFDRLKDESTEGYSGHCWGYNFPWQSRDRYLNKGDPTAVNTSFASNAILDLYDTTGDQEYLEVARSSCEFILRNLNITERPEGICFSYTPFDRHLCHNANLLSAELLSRVYSITKEEDLLQYAQRALEFTLCHQNPDGSWHYSIDPVTGRPRRQIDFHQGFILESLHNFIKYIKPSDGRYLHSLRSGADFYRREQFLCDGRGKYRWPRTYPIDIHSQAQGIITFSKLSAINPEYLFFAKKIAEWTLTQMQDESGFFYYQRWPFFTNKIPYMRWGQAWMALALATLWEHSRED